MSNFSIALYLHLFNAHKVKDNLIPRGSPLQQKICY